MEQEREREREREGGREGEYTKKDDKMHISLTFRAAEPLTKLYRLDALKDLHCIYIQKYKF